MKGAFGVKIKKLAAEALPSALDKVVSTLVRVLKKLIVPIVKLAPGVVMQVYVPHLEVVARALQVRRIMVVIQVVLKRMKNVWNLLMKTSASRLALHVVGVLSNLNVKRGRRRVMTVVLEYVVIHARTPQNLSPVETSKGVCGARIIPSVKRTVMDVKKKVITKVSSVLIFGSFLEFKTLTFYFFFLDQMKVKMMKMATAMKVKVVASKEIHAKGLSLTLTVRSMFVSFVPNKKNVKKQMTFATKHLKPPNWTLTTKRHSLPCATMVLVQPIQIKSL